MKVTREQAKDCLKSIEVAPIFEQSYESKRLPKELDIFFGPPEEFFLAPDTQRSYSNAVLIPILDDGNFDRVLFYDPQTNSFVEKSIEEPDYACPLASWQQYLASLMIRIIEGIDAEDSELAEIADLIAFKHLDKTLAFLDSVLEDDDYREKQNQFIAELTEHPA